MFGNWPSYDSGLFNEFRRLEQDLDELLGRWRMPGAGIRSVAQGTFPPVNAGVTGEQVDVYMFAPGLDAGKLDVTVQNNLLTVTGERDLDEPENATYYRRERHGGGFRRVVTLPEDVDPDNVRASYRDGILHVTVPRQESTKPRRVEIQ